MPENQNTDTQNTVDSGEALEVQSLQNSEPSLADVMSAIQALEAKTDGKFKQIGQDFGRLRAKVKGEGETPTPASAAPQNQNLTATDVTSLVASTMELGQILGGLSQEARTGLQEAIQDLPPESAVKVARAFASTAPGIGGVNEITGQARSPKPPSPKPSHPRTQGEFLAVRQKALDGDKTAQARVEAMDRDPDFDPTALPRRLS